MYQQYEHPIKDIMERRFQYRMNIEKFLSKHDAILFYDCENTIETEIPIYSVLALNRTIQITYKRSEYKEGMIFPMDVSPRIITRLADSIHMIEEELHRRKLKYFCLGQYPLIPLLWVSHELKLASRLLRNNTTIVAHRLLETLDGNRYFLYSDKEYIENKDMIVWLSMKYSNNPDSLS